MDVWYLDDGTIALLPELAVPYLLAYDRITHQQGGKRNFAKTITTIYASNDDIAANSHLWRMDRLRELCTVNLPNNDNKTLGVGLGGPERRVADFGAKVLVAQKMHDRLRRMGSSGPELALAQACLGVAKVTHYLRACGDELHEDGDALRAFDKMQDGTLDRLVPGCDAESKVQASLSLRVGGLGMRRTKDVALPAAIASRAIAWPKIKQLDDAFAKAGLLKPGQLLHEHESALTKSKETLRTNLDPAEAAQIEELVDGAIRTATQAWTSRCSGRGSEARAPRAQWTALTKDEHVQPRHGGESTLASGNGPGDPFEDNDGADALPEHGQSNGSRLTVTNLQRQLSILVDNTILRRLVLHLERAGSYADMRRLEELRDPSVDHGWIRRLSIYEGPVPREEDYVLSLQLRLGAKVVADSYKCPECDRLVDCQLYHSTCCAKAERTKGHYAVVRTVFDRIVEADSSATLEQRGLVEAEPGARPGDIYTVAAVPNRDAAVDVTIVSQEAAGAGTDCVATAHAGKFERYKEAVAEWGADGPCLQPMVWSCEGRAHPDVARVMNFCANKLAQRNGVSAKSLLQRWRADIGVALAVRRARMARRCLPPRAARAAWILHGDVGDDIGGVEAASGALGIYTAGASADNEGDGCDES